MAAKRFVILHSNDMHGDFLAEQGNEKMIGGLALLSGYINKVRKEEENVLYVISGDMLQGSIIDSEYKGVSTMEIMNYLCPDVVALGNHEFDYGLPHLLFLEKVANFPIVNANLYIKPYNKRLMKPYLILNKAGFDVLFTGIVTEKVIDALAKDKLIGSFVTLKEAAGEVGRICNAYKNDDIDLTICLTHIGFDSDKELARLLDPGWGVDMIIGGHSHTVLEQPEKINNILIAQAGVGTDQIGRFDILVDDDTNSIIEWKWQLIPIDSSIAEPDKRLLDYIQEYKKEVDKKYSSILCKLSGEMTHPDRTIETSLGNLFADAFKDVSGADVVLIGSGSIRTKKLGPLVTLQEFMTSFPYSDSMHRFSVKGCMLKRAFGHFMRKENRGGEGECYQVNSGVSAKYSESRRCLSSLEICGKPVDDGKDYTICMPGYHYNNVKAYLDLDPEELGQGKVITTSMQEVMEEYLRDHQNIGGKVEGRLLFLD